MKQYFQIYETFCQDNKALKNGTITAQQLLPAIVRHIVRTDRKFTLLVNGRLPKPMNELLDDVFELIHLQKPFYTQHCASRSYRYMNVSKNRVKIDFTMKYRMARDEEKWIMTEIDRILKRIIQHDMTDFEKVCAVHNYIVRHYNYELNTDGSPFAVYTFMHEKQGVCMAYALLFEKMMEELSIPCYYVVGKADGESDLGHAWNMVQLNGEWFHIDATWNDLGSRTPNHEIRYRYFLRDDDFMKRDHIWNFDHYPICKSTRYEGLCNIYDAAFSGKAFYFPHPKTAKLTRMTTEKLTMEPMLDAQVQYCVLLDGKLYASHYGQGAALYCHVLGEKTFTLVDARKVEAIHSTIDAITVTFEGGETLVIERETGEIDSDDPAHYETATLTHFGTSWFGHYKRAQADAFVRFADERGVAFTVQQSFKELTVDIFYEQILQIELTAKRKHVHLESAATLIIPHTVLHLPKEVKATLNGAACHVEHLADVTIITK